MDRSLKHERTGAEVGLVEDLSTLLGDNSFSDVTSDDSSGWMHKIDVTNFKELTSGVPAEYLLSNPQINAQTSLVTSHHLQQQQQQQGLLLELPSPATNVSTTTGTFRPSNYERLFPQQEVSEKFDNRPNSNSRGDQQLLSPTVSSSTKSNPKPLYSYSCLIALALKNSKTGRLQVSEIYAFMCENFPYFRSAQPGWKNSVRHNLSLNKCFEKIVVETAGGHGRKCCLWTLNPNKTAKMEQEIRKWREKDIAGVRESLANPEDLNLIEMGLKGMPGEHKPIVLQTLPDVVPFVRNNFLQTTPSNVQNSHRNWYYASSRSCLTPPRPETFDSHYSIVTCPSQVYSPPTFSTPIRRSFKCDSPLSITSSYSPNPCGWRLDPTISGQDFLSINNKHDSGFGAPLSASPIAGSLSSSPWKYPSTTDYSCATPYQTALSATDPNNSLLQTALSMSCATPKVTLQSL